MCANGHDCGKVHRKIASGSKKKAYEEVCELSKTLSKSELVKELRKRISEL